MANEKNVIPKRKSNGKNSPVIGDNGISTVSGDNTRYSKILRIIGSWEKPDRKDIVALEQRLEDYLIFCEQNDIKIGNQMCYLALGIDKNTAYDWENGRSFGKEHSDFIKKIKAICAGNREMLMQDGKVNPITGIFWQKNYDGLKDVQEIEITPKNSLGDSMTPEQIAERLPSPTDEVVDFDD